MTQPRYQREQRKKPEDLRSARWFAPDDLRSFGHRSRLMQMGYGPVWALEGSMVAYQGSLRFEKKSTGVQRMLKGADLDVALQFVNYR